MYLATKQVRRGKVLSARKNLQEQLKRRRSFERRLTPQIQKWFSFTAREAVDLLESSRPIELTKSRNELSKILSSHYQAVIKSFGDNFHYIKRKQEDKFDLYYRQYMVEFGGQKITNMTRTQQQRIIAVIDRSEFTGVADIGKQIREANKPTMTKARSVLIARTETHSASNYSNHQVAKEVGIPMKKRWVATNDDRTRSHHSSISGTEVGMDEDFEIVVNGIPYKMAYAGDPRGGAVNTINCRCVVMYVEPEDVVVDTTEPITETPAKPKVPVPPKPANDLYSVVRNPSLTMEGIRLISKKEGKQKIEETLKKASQDERYLNKTFSTYTNRKPKDFGEANLKGLNDQDVSLLVPLMDEMKEICDKFDVPYIRGIKTIGGERNRLNGSMGDGVLAINHQRFIKDFSDEIGKDKKQFLDDLEKTQRAKIEDDIAGIRNRMESQQKEMKILLDDGKIEFSDLTEREQFYYKRMESRVNSLFTILKNKELELENFKIDVPKLDVSTWKRGDNLGNRPWSSKEYFDNKLDRFRAFWYHELGHHIHQMYRLDVGGNKFGSFKSPLEDYFKTKRFGKKFREENSPSLYGRKNEHEFFVENFALYYMGKRDLVSPEFIQILKAIENDEVL